MIFLKNLLRDSFSPLFGSAEPLIIAPVESYHFLQEYLYRKNFGILKLV